MTENNHDRNAFENCSVDKSLTLEFHQLWDQANVIWDRHQNDFAFRGYVSADYSAVCESLNSMVGQVTTVLEWGSGLGIVTIMASRLGFEAYGIEAESALVEYSESLAKSFAPSAQFAHGSFIPDAFEWNPAYGEEVNQTMIDIPSAYAALDMDLDDFDLIYAYPWPEEHILFQNILRQFGNRNSSLLTYDAREGIQVISVQEMCRKNY